MPQATGGGVAEAAELEDVSDILKTVRSNLGMDIGFVGRFVGSDRVFRHVDAAGSVAPFRQGDGSPLEDSYCARIVDGRLPELIPDTGQLPETRTMAVTHDFPVGAHLSVPIRLSDGSVYGTFCCFSHEPNPTLNERDLSMLRSFADIAARRIDRSIGIERAVAARCDRVRAVIAAGGPSIVYQPVFLLDGLRPAGSEALARFRGEPPRPPDVWFEEAGEVGLQVELELAAARNALEGYRAVWREHPVQLGLNASAATIVDERFFRLFDGLPTERIVVELTEHERVGDYAPLVAELACLRASGIKIAIDDVGAGYSNMKHILTIRPNIMKLDVGLVRSIDTDPMKLALATALVAFAGQFDCRIVAEGVETPAELETLRCLDVQAVQGYLLGRPEPAAALLRLLSTTTAR